MRNRGSLRRFSESHRAKATRSDRTIFLPHPNPIPPPPSRQSHQPGHAAESSHRFPPQESGIPSQGSRQPRQRSQPPEQRSGLSRQESRNLPQGSRNPGQRSGKLRHGSGDLRQGSELPNQGEWASGRGEWASETAELSRNKTESSKNLPQPAIFTRISRNFTDLQLTTPKHGFYERNNTTSTGTRPNRRQNPETSRPARQASARRNQQNQHHLRRHPRRPGDFCANPG